MHYQAYLIHTDAYLYDAAAAFHNEHSLKYFKVHNELNKSSV